MKKCFCRCGSSGHNSSINSEC